MGTDIGLVIENLTAGLRNYGYRVISQPVAGREAEYADELRQALSRVERNADYYRKTYGLRGRSKRLLELLRAADPFPAWGVEKAGK
jgi:hypothetical protein